MSIFTKVFLGAIISASGFISVGYAGDIVHDEGLVEAPPHSDFSKFKPNNQVLNTRLNYDALDAALENTVFRLGISKRKHMTKPSNPTGTRMISGHKSPYRLEGSRVMFSFLTDEYRGELTAYREDLERIGSELELTKLSKAEQLAFWLNLHNVVMIEQIANHYPVKRPHLIKIDGVLLNDAKIITLKGTKLSLRDIRENIVYPNWNNPNVIYGFFHGNIGSPAIQNFAYTGQNVSEVLSIQAVEFVNSLRGFHKTPGSRKVSKIYDEARPFYFPNWETDLPKHLEARAREDVAADIRIDRPIEIDRYDYIVADLMAGDRTSIASPANWVINARTGQPNFDDYPVEIRRLISELVDKQNTLRSRGLVKKGRVIIEDIEIEDVD